MGTKRYDYDVEDIVSMYKNGAFCSDIAAKYGMSVANVSYILRKNGFTRNARGGAVASMIPKREFQVEPEKKRDEELDAIAAKNAVNACLVVESREVALKGTVGEYHVFGKDRRVVVAVGDGMLDIAFDTLPDFISELKAIARNMGGAGTRMRNVVI